jgi:hypothetical protein
VIHILRINNTTCFHINNNSFLSTEDIDVFLLTLTIFPNYLLVQHYSVVAVHILGVFFEVEIHSSDNMMHGICRFASFYVTLLFFIKMYYLTHWVDSKLHQNSSSLQLTADVSESRHSHLSKYFDHLHPDISLLIMKWRKCQTWFT